MMFGDKHDSSITWELLCIGNLGTTHFEMQAYGMDVDRRIIGVQNIFVYCMGHMGVIQIGYMHTVLCLCSYKFVDHIWHCLFDFSILSLKMFF
jgi:hypothetical protein